MKTSLRLLLCLIFISLSYSPGFTQGNHAEYDSVIEPIFPKDGPGGTVLVAKAGRVIYQRDFGFANLEHQVPMSQDHVFRLGSVTKQFTAVCILKLAEEGKLSLEDELTKFIPDYPAQGKKITIANLLSHTSGIKNYTGVPAFSEALKRKDLRPEEIIALFKGEGLDFDPGSDQRYSNSNYILLGYIIEKLSGKSYGDYVQEHIFKPLDMTHSCYDMGTEVITGRVSGYRKRGDRYENAEFLSMTLPYAAGSLMSTTGDLLKWYQWLSAGKIISAASLEKAFSSWILANGKDSGYGFGWWIGNIQGNRAVMHNGVINGFFTDVIYLPAQQILVCVLSNYENVGDLDIPAAKLAAIAINTPYHYEPVALKSAVLQEYHGVYQNAFDGERYISNQRGVLMYYYRGGGKTCLIPTGKDVFVLENSLNKLSFQRDQAGKIAGYKLEGTGVASNWLRSRDNEVLEKIQVSDQLMQSYAGKYLFEPNMVFEVVIENGKLYGRVGKDQKELVPYGKHRFYAWDLDARLIFQLDHTGKVTGVTKMEISEIVSTSFRAKVSSQFSPNAFWIPWTWR
ncbi:serine hydrolase [Pedobacter sp. GR22-6]|uniref:serine hydrolase n=1 Tax=Pedobacter sp. GR22-6 TaxID=3127957 RepID=UPI00307E54E1